MTTRTHYSLFALALAACAADPIGPDDPTHDDTVYTRTIVTFADNGTATATQEPITVAEQRAEHAEAMRAVAGNAPESVLANADCGSWYATKFFDQTDYVGNELCIVGSGSAWFSDYYRRVYPYWTATWEAAVRSYWTGVNWVGLVNNYTGCSDGAEPPYEAFASASYCARSATSFVMQP